MRTTSKNSCLARTATMSLPTTASTVGELERFLPGSGRGFSRRSKRRDSIPSNRMDERARVNRMSAGGTVMKEGKLLPIVDPWKLENSLRQLESGDCYRGDMHAEAIDCILYAIEGCRFPIEARCDV